MSHKPTSPGGVCAVCGREGSKHELAIHYNTLSCIGKLFTPYAQAVKAQGAGYIASFLLLLC